MQCIKCAIWHDLLFREPAPLSISEAKETCDEDQKDVGVGAGGDLGGVEESDVEETWDGLLIDEDKDNDNEEMMYCWSS
jgi:hypothetical protein